MRAGLASYRNPTYEESLKEITPDNYEIYHRFETEQCTIIVGEIFGTPHVTGASMYLIYKPGSTVGEGVVKTLPLPIASGWGAGANPQQIYLSDDGSTLYYNVNFEDGLTIDGVVLHEAGTYRYATDLATGETALEYYA